MEGWKIGDSAKVLDHGLVRLVDYMGSDLAISRNARVSYDAPAREEDKGLIEYLMENGHNTPFEAFVIVLFSFGFLTQNAQKMKFIDDLTTFWKCFEK